VGESESVVESVLGQAQDVEYCLLSKSLASLEDLLAGEL